MKVLVFELNSYHLELLPMYQPLLPSLFENRRLDIHYFVLPALVERAREAVGNQVFSLNTPRLRYLLPTKHLRAAYYRWRIQRLVDQLDPVAMVFNTVEPPAYLRVFRQIHHPTKIGIIHNPRRAGLDHARRGSGELIFCLHDYNYRLCAKEELVDGYLSPFFKYRDLAAARVPDDRVEIAVQGVISFARRDYPMLIDVCQLLAKRSTTPPVRFNIVGDADIRDGPKLRQMVAERGLDQYFRLHSWLADKEFFEQLGQADYIMPLISPGRGAYAEQAKVTAALGHAGAYGTPLLVHREIATLWGIPDDGCVRYSTTEDLGEMLVRGLGHRARMVQRHREVVAEKIRQNLDFLAELASSHPALRSARTQSGREPDRQ